MAFITVSKNNVKSEHICCAISASKEALACAGAKKEWMCDQFPHGYEFIKLDEKGKVFIEITPAESAWCPVCANNWLFIDCFWVSGKFKGQGHAGRLLDAAKARAIALGCDGLAALSASKKMAFLSDGDFYKSKGFVVADTSAPYYELLALPLTEGAALPSFGPSLATELEEDGVGIWYSDHCPHNSKYVPRLRAVCEEAGVPFHEHKLQSIEQAQAAPNPFTTYALYYNGKFVTNEIFSEGKMKKFLEGAVKS